VPDSKKPTLLLIDGHSLAFRAFYALPVDSFVTRDGQHTNAIHGFLSMLNLLLQNERPTHLAVAFDKSRVSFRTAEYPEYKGTRGETPPEFKGQIPLLQKALAAMNIPTLEVDNYEADDIIATLATKGAADGFHVLVTSGDRDTIQLVNDDITLLYPNARGVSELKRYDRDAVFEKYGIEPEQYPEIAALVGETSDNLIGIDKVGEKTAVKWIQQYGSLDNLLAHADEITGVVGGYLRDQQDRAVRNRKLNRLVTDMELPLAPADLARAPMDVDAVRELFGRLQFKALLERLLKIEGVTDEGQLTDGGAATSELPPVQTPIGIDLEAWLEKHSEGGTAPLGVRVALIGGRVDGVRLGVGAVGR
jgi:DNA polymerase-1